MSNFNPRTISQDLAYKSLGSWRCPNSPTRAHHWIIRNGQMKCKYCLEVRKLDEKGLVIIA